MCTAVQMCTVVLMYSTQITTDSEASTLTALVDDLELTFSPTTDDRVIGVEDGKVLVRSNTTALELASEMRAWGIREARAFGSAVVFWS